MPTTCSTRSRHRTITIPAPRLEQIRAPLLAVNWADDLINPPELGILEREIRRVAHGSASVMPFTALHARGHESQMLAAGWKHHLLQLLASAPHR
jgi:homoserine O-acetyltransferase